MNYRIRTHKVFDKEAKRLGKKYPSLKKDLIALGNGLLENPLLGVDLGNGFRKIRLAITSKRRGKAGGARVITYTICTSGHNGRVYLVDVYDKADYSNVDVSVIKKRIADLELL